MMSINNNNNAINNTSKKIAYCKNCGIVFEKNGRAQKFCVDCKPIREKEMREKYRKAHSEQHRVYCQQWRETHRKGESRAEKKARLMKNMVQLREAGFTNLDIAKNCKVTINTVRYYIGKEPVEYWLNAVRAGAKTRVAKNKIHSRAVHQRKKIMCEIKVEEQQKVFNAALISLDEAKKREAEAQKIAHAEQRKLNELKQALQAC